MTLRDRSLRDGARGVGGSIRDGLMWLLKAPIRLLEWKVRQIRGTWRGLNEIADSFAFDRVIPSGIAGLIQEILTRAKWAAGADSKQRGVFSAIVLIIFGVLTSWFYFGMILIAIGVLLLVFNLLRSVPWISDLWRGSRVRGTIKRDRDIPVWRRE